MGNTSEQTRMAKYRASSDVVKTTYGDEKLGNIIGDLVNQFSYTPEIKKVFIDVVGDTILGIISIENFQKELVAQCKLTPVDALKVEQKIASFLVEIYPKHEFSQQIPDADSSLKEKLELRPEVTAPSTSDAPVRPLTREEVLKSLAPARTMAQDIATLKSTSASPTVPPSPAQ